MRKFPPPKTFAALFGLAAFAASPAWAGPILGSDTVGAQVISTNETGGNLGTSTTALLGSTNETFSLLAVGNGSFSVIPIGATVALGAAALDFADASTFSFTSSAVGDFTANSIHAFDQTPTSIDLFITGLFTPGTDFPAGSTAPLGASENLAFTQTNGGQISLSGTFASPPANSPVPVPEPFTVAIFGAGLAGLGGLRRRKAKGPIAV
jgi:hypothetical protein